MKIPACILAAFDIVVRPIFVEDETFPEKLRKVALLVFVGMASSAIPSIAIAIIVPQVDPYDHGWIAFRTMLLIAGIHVGSQFVLFNYTYLRIKKHCPLWLADVSSLGACMAAVEFSLANPHTDNRALLILISLMTAMLATPRLPLILILQFFVYYFGYFRDYWREVLPFLVLSFDHPPGTLFERIVQLAAFSLGPALAGVTGIHVLVRAYIRQNEEQRLARKMTLAVAKSLTVYDIDGVEATLKENEGLVDGELLESFNDIKENLKAFRPHIPQYLIEAAVERSQRRSSDNSDDDDSEGDVDSLSYQSLSHEGINLDVNGNRRRRDSASRTSASSQSSWKHEEACVQKTHHPHALASKDAYHGQVTSAFIDLGVKNVLNGFVQMAAAVDAINDAASATRTSVHSIQGDAIFASWNATSRVANHAVHACGFAAKMREALATFSALRVSGSIVQTACHTVFAGTKQSHLLLIGEGITQHAEQRRLGRELSTLVVNESVAVNAETWGMFLGFTTNADGGVVYDLVGPHEQHADNEWMYQLESAKNPWEVVTAGLKAELSGEKKAAVLDRVLQSLTPDQLERPSVGYFRKEKMGC